MNKSVRKRIFLSIRFLTILGKEKYSQNTGQRKVGVGIVHGLARTSVGGVVLEIEVNTMPGKWAMTGEIMLRGSCTSDWRKNAEMKIVCILTKTCKDVEEMEDELRREW